MSGSAAVVERTFHITLRTYRHPDEARAFYAPETEPTVDVGLRVADISGLTDYYRMYPKSHRMNLPARSGAVAKSGSAPDGFSFFGDDFRNAYVPGTTLTGAGQMVGLVQFLPTALLVFVAGHAADRFVAFPGSGGSAVS